MKTYFFLLGMWLLPLMVSAQLNPSPFFGFNDPTFNPIRVATPFLAIENNPYTIGIGNIGVISSNERVSSAHSQNPALLLNGDYAFELSANHMSWDVRTIDRDPFFINVNAAIQLNSKHAIGLRWQYFDIENPLTLTDENGELIEFGNTWEMAPSLSYAFRFHPKWSIGLGLKYVISNLFGTIDLGSTRLGKGTALAGDLGIHFRDTQAFDQKTRLNWQVGLALQNMGRKIKYIKNSQTTGNYLPATIRFGGLFGLERQLKGEQRIHWSLAFQLDKLMVPTPCIVCLDENQNGLPDETEYTAFEGMIRSFSDGENYQEIVQKFGLEMAYAPNALWLFSFRTAYQYQHPTKGTDQILTFGSSLQFKGFYLDVAFVVDPVLRDGEVHNQYHKKLIAGLGYRKNIKDE